LINKFFVFLVALFLTSPAFAQESPLPSSSNEPLEITADGSLEWNRNDKLFIARQNALAKQGDSSIKAETLTAHYREGQGGGMDIYQVEADSGVVLNSKDSVAYGDKANYDLDKAYAVMTGNNLRMESPDQIVTAKDRFEYWTTDGKLVAVGDAKVDRKNAKGETDRLQADTISAILKDNAQGKRALDSIEATGNVVITTPTETITGSRGIYRAGPNKAEMTGGVVIHRGPNVLKGDRAEVDLNTNTSQMFGGQGMSKQVKGVFYPGSDKKAGK
jgi:lipopolysaccharide export system protein LptA